MRYVVSVKREKRQEAPSDWQDRVLQTPGVSLIGGSKDRLTVDLTSGALERIQKELSDYCHIEKEIEFQPAGF